PQIAVLSLSGGEAWVITDLLKGASKPVWSPDHRRIAFFSSTSPKDIERAKAKAAHPPAAAAGDAKNTAKPEPRETEAEHEPDLHLITRAVWRSNASGYLDFEHPDHLWVVEVPATSDEHSTPIQLTKGDFDEDEALWTPDGQRIFFLTTRVPE